MPSYDVFLYNFKDILNKYMNALEENKNNLSDDTEKQDKDHTIKKLEEENEELSI